MIAPTGRIIYEDRGFAREMQRLAKSSAKALVGFPNTRIRSKNSPEMTIHDIAMKMEYGSVEERIPARPFLANTVSDHASTVQKMLNEGADRILRGKDAVEVLKPIAVWFEGKVKETIREGDFVKLAALTIANRRNRTTPPPNMGTKPLNDTLEMLNRVTSKVVRVKP